MSHDTNHPKNRTPASPGKGGGMRDELERLDRDIVSLIARRTALSAKATAKRVGKKVGLADPVLEKRLWAAWTDQCARVGLDHRPLRRFFGLLNAVGYSSADKKAPKGDAYMLAPRRAPLKVSITGPRMARTARMWATLAAMSGAERTLARVVKNDPMIELVRTLNQTGAHLSWDESTLASLPGKGLVFEEQLVFCGGDAFNFALVLAMALPTAGRCTFAGTMDLKLMDLDALSRFMPALGTRLSGLDPNNPGLPARMESSGDIPSHISLPPELDPDMASALALAAWNYPEGLTMAFVPGSAQERALDEAVRMLNACGVAARMETGSVTVPKSVVNIPETMDAPLDPELNAYLLAMPAFTGGEVRLAGAWPETPATREIADMLDLVGTTLETGEDFVRAASRGLSERPVFSCAPSPRLLPLALALGLAAKNGAEISLSGLGGAEADAGDFLDRLGRSWSLEGDVVRIEPGPLSWDTPWLTPDPWFSMALALLGWVRPGLSLRNPGEMTGVWPGFWTLYNALPEVEGDEKLIKETRRDEPKSSRKRIRVR